jgi:GNAT superfamily N-acetyltransferase
MGSGPDSAAAPGGAALRVRRAGSEDCAVVVQILQEAARWLEQRGQVLWRDAELQPERIAMEVRQGLYRLAESPDAVLGTIRFQLEDPEFWPDLLGHEAAYVHRLAVRRSAAGGAVSRALLRWAVEHTRSLGLCYLRLDCEAARPRLRALYEDFGFRHHSDRQVGPYYVARYEYPIQGTQVPRRQRF